MKEQNRLLKDNTSLILLKTCGFLGINKSPPTSDYNIYSVCGFLDVIFAIPPSLSISTSFLSP